MPKLGVEVVLEVDATADDFLVDEGAAVDVLMPPPPGTNTPLGQ